MSDGSAPAPGSGPAVLSVAELAGAAKRLLETGLGEVRVRGEIAGLKLAASGHRYFSLRGEGAAVECVLYKQAARFLATAPQEGLEVILRGRVSLYEPQGRFQLLVSRLEAAGEGALRLQIEKLKQKLAAEGLFAEDRKRPIPAVPRGIGVVTSERGAVWHDIRNVLRRRLRGYHLVLAPAAVQGEAAPREITRALRALAARPGIEVILCGRGGGSLLDLMAFNDESVVRAIAASPVPVISCVGHETDWTLADLAADLRAPTPSAAAELAARGAGELLEKLAGLRRDLAECGRLAVAARQQHLDFLAQRRAFAEVRYRLGRAAQSLDGARRTLSRPPPRLQAFAALLARARAQFAPAALRAAVRENRARLATLPGRQSRALRGLLAGVRGRGETLVARLDGVSPLRPLARGYSLVQTDRGRLVRQAAETRPGQNLALRFADGAVRARVLPDAAAVNKNKNQQDEPAPLFSDADMPVR